MDEENLSGFFLPRDIWSLETDNLHNSLQRFHAQLNRLNCGFSSKADHRIFSTFYQQGYDNRAMRDGKGDLKKWSNDVNHGLFIHTAVFMYNVDKESRQILGSSVRFDFRNLTSWFFCCIKYDPKTTRWFSVVIFESEKVLNIASETLRKYLRRPTRIIVNEVTNSHDVLEINYPSTPTGIYVRIKNNYLVIMTELQSPLIDLIDLVKFDDEHITPFKRITLTTCFTFRFADVYLNEDLERVYLKKIQLRHDSTDVFFDAFDFNGNHCKLNIPQWDDEQRLISDVTPLEKCFFLTVWNDIHDTPSCLKIFNVSEETSQLVKVIELPTWNWKTSFRLFCAFNEQYISAIAEKGHTNYHIWSYNLKTDVQKTFSEGWRRIDAYDFNWSMKELAVLDEKTLIVTKIQMEECSLKDLTRVACLQYFNTSFLKERLPKSLTKYLGIS
eukprot:TCONS_00072252-protein